MQGRPPIVTGFTMPSGRAARPASSASCVLSGRDPDVRGGGPHLPSLHRPLRSRATATAPRPSKSRWAASGRRSLSSWVLRSPTVTEEIEELYEATAQIAGSSNDPQASLPANLNHSDIEAEFGDVLFSMVNVSRFLRINPEEALRKATNKFITRFQYIESQASNQGQTIKECTPEKLDQWWEAAKSQEPPSSQLSEIIDGAIP